MERQSDYDPNALLPKVRTRWVWEIDQPHARCLIEVTEVRWNGEAWHVATTALLPAPPYLNGFAKRSPDPVWNDLSRFWEAVTPVGSTIGRMSERRSEVATA